MAFPLPTDLVNGTIGLIGGIASWAYIVTNGWFWVALLATFWVVLFISTSRYSTDRAFGFASVSGMLGSFFLVTLNLMSWWVASIFIILGILGIVWMKVRSD